MKQNHEKWLEATAHYFDISPDEIINGKNRSHIVSRARKSFYYLCFRDGIDLYRLSQQLGKHRTTIINCMYNTQNRDVESEHAIRNLVENRTLDSVIGYWLGQYQSKSKDIVLTSLIAQKQRVNLEYENIC